MKKLVSLGVGVAIALAIVKRVSGRREGEGGQAPRLRDRARGAAAHRDPRTAVTASVDGAIGTAAGEVGGPHPTPDGDAADQPGTP